MKKLILAAAVILAGCGGTDATGPSGANSNVPTIKLIASSGTNLSGYFGNYVVGVPQVTVTNATGVPSAGVTVSFVATGGGVIRGASVVTDAAGVAQPTNWRLGSSGTQAVTATVAGATPVTFTATANPLPPSSFHIDVRYAANTNPTVAEKAAFDAAAARWSTLLLQGGGPTQIQEFVPGCGNDIRGETVSGLVITADLTAIDGAGKILGSSAPCLLRDEGYLPAQGYMQFDTADLDMLEANGQLDEVILHEMGHVLGFGTIWEFNPGQGSAPNTFLSRAVTDDPFFSGASAISALLGVTGGIGVSGTGVPVEATGGSGTAYAHWRETTFGNELMTGWLDHTPLNPLSAITVDQFRDLGYLVNDAAADGYTLASAIQAAAPPSVSGGTALVEKPLTLPLVVINRQGYEVRRLPRK